jgi:HD-GYP domain-containing protein (c-di-GMP phosphodiesterase class II)
MQPEHQARVSQIARHPLKNEKGEAVRFLSQDEEDNLNIAYGTLSKSEREVINYHISATIKMLEALPWPRHLLSVPEYAGGHHERMDGKGYPRGLTREQMSVQARVMGIADIFEALTAKDRPYKPGKTLSESLAILGNMRLGGHIDPDLFDIFVRDKVYMRYAKEFLDPEQIDEVDESAIPGYAP